MSKNFVIKNGNNGATYIFNISSLSSIFLSLKFYKSFTFKQLITKSVLYSYLLFSKIFLKKESKNIEELKDYFKKDINSTINFDLNDDCSILISPTRDKVIIHNHDKNYFHKYAFGNSKENVLNEVSIYKLFEKEAEFFNTSLLSEVISDDNYCEFKLFNKPFDLKTDDIVNTLVEFFSFAKNININIETLVNEKYIIDDELKDLSNFLIKKYSKEELSLGLVHRDFKPWNLDSKSGPLIYDFEESILDGLPAEDLLNYYIDPMMSSNNIEEIEEFIFSKELVTDLKRYSKGLGLDLENKVLIYLYLMDRVLFWKNKHKEDLYKKYKALLNSIFSKEELNG